MTSAQVIKMSFTSNSSLQNCILSHLYMLLPTGTISQVKVIPLKLFYYQTFFETWRD